MFEKLGFKAERAWGSDGRALKMSADVDVKVEGILPKPLGVQAKRKGDLPKWMDRGQGKWDLMVLRKDNGETIVLLSWSMLCKLTGWNNAKDS